MKVVEEMKKLKFPQGQYVIVGSGPLVVRGIRETNDIDIVVSPKLFEKCKKDWWEQLPRTYPDKIGQIYVRHGYVELFLDVNCADFNPTREELVQRADIIEGIAFASLEDMIKFKQSYNKPKHWEDIKRIEKYLKENS